MLTRHELAKAGYPKHAKTLDWAESTIGEREEPLGSNTGKFVEFCQRASWLPGSRWAWCRAYNLRAHLKGGFTLPDRSAGAWDALSRAWKRGDALSPADYDRAIPGDEVIWAFGSGHSSILVGFEVKGGVRYVHSIDGNVQDRVEPCERPLSLVKGFVVWHESPKPVKKPVKPPRFQVVGSVSGRRQLVTRKGRVIKLPPKKAGHAGIVRKPAVTYAGATTASTSSGRNVHVTVTVPTHAKPKPKPRKKPAPKRRYYKLKRNVPLKKGQTLGYQPGKGYYARPKKTA